MATGVDSPLKAPLDDFLARVTALNAAMHILVAHTQTALNALDRHTEDHGAELDPLFGSRVPLEDLADIPDDGWRRFRLTPHVSIVLANEARTATAKVLETVGLLVVAQAYEALETLLFSSIAVLSWREPTTVDKRKVELWSRKHSAPQSLEEHQQFVRFAYRGKNNAEILGRSRELAPRLARVEQHNTMGVALDGWVRVASIVRHAATHSAGTIRREDMLRLSGEDIAVLKKWFPGSGRETAYALSIDPDHAEKALWVLHNYGYAVHKSLSLEYGYVPAYSDGSP